MSDVKRYEWDEDDGDWYCEGFTPVAGDALIRASDYDALAARLAEAEKRMSDARVFIALGSYSRASELLAPADSAESARKFGEAFVNTFPGNADSEEPAHD